MFRIIKVEGRFLHNKAILLPTKKLYGLEGYEYVVPLCTKETVDGIPLEGVLVNKGFIPFDKYHPATRYRIENSFKPETIYGYVS